MADQIKLNDRFTVGLDAPTEATLRDLAAQGIKAVVNLRTPGESDQPLDPDREGTEVRGLGMAYRHLPIPADFLRPELVDAFRQTVADLPGPVYVHCASGKRSGALTLIEAALEDGRTGEEALAEARRRGLAFDDAPTLTRFVKDAIDSREPPQL